MDTPEYTDDQASLKSRPLTFWQRFTSRRDYAIGILFLLIVVFLWTSGSFITQVSLHCFCGPVRTTEPNVPVGTI